jgi:ribosome-binding factor A
MRQFKRSDRIRSQMLRDVQTLLEPECAAHLPAMVTFTDVEISLDLRYATIFYSVLGDERAREKADAFLNGMQKRVKSQLGKLLQIKHAPEVKFRFDPSIERGMRIEQILNELSKKNEEQQKKDI